MDTTFLSSLLLVSLLILLGIYLYQLMQKAKVSGGGKMVGGEKFLPIIWDTCPSDRKDGMPVHRVGPVYNFHQHFNKYNPRIGAAGFCPTGIPEMGWRNYYLENYNRDEVKKEDAFAGTPIRNFLDNMENVDNLYRKC